MNILLKKKEEDLIPHSLKWEGNYAYLYIYIYIYGVRFLPFSRRRSKNEEPSYTSYGCLLGS
jgi:hypothetical protein